MASQGQDSDLSEESPLTRNRDPVRHPQYGQMVTIVCGDDKVYPRTMFLVCKEVLCRESPYFERMFNGVFEESRTNEAHLKEDDPETFSLFLDWLYTGKYKVVPRTWVGGYHFCHSCGEKTTNGHICPAVATPDSQELFCRICGMWGADSSVFKREVCKLCVDTGYDAKLGRLIVDRSLRFPISNRFCQLLTKTGDIPHLVLSMPGQHSDRHSNKLTYNEDLLRHAKVWTFANKVMIDSLQRYSLRQLHEDLCMLRLNGTNIKSIVDLVRYVDQHTQAAVLPVIGDFQNSLRPLVLEYLVANSLRLSKTSEEFDVALRNGGEFEFEFLSAWREYNHGIAVPDKDKKVWSWRFGPRE